MNTPDDHGLLNFNWSLTLLHALVQSGCETFVFSPGSRNTPLALAAHYHPEISPISIIDERAAAFFALGNSKPNLSPTVLVCTSGTAGANYFPALIEAHQSDIPLIILTADRPPSLRDIGASQTIDQVKLFGNVTHFFEAGEPSSSPKAFDRLRRLGIQAVTRAQSTGRPFHINLPFSKPLEPSPSLLSELPRYTERIIQQTSFPATWTEAQESVVSDQLFEVLCSAERPLFIIGPVAHLLQNTLHDGVHWAVQHNIPVLAEPLSQVKTNTTICGYDQFLRNEQIRESLSPDLIIRLGNQPISKSISLFLEHYRSIPQICIREDAAFTDETLTSAMFFQGKVDWSTAPDHTFDHEWLLLWETLATEALSRLNELDQRRTLLTDGAIYRAFEQAEQDDVLIHVSNSFPVRDFDLFEVSHYSGVLGNRGASGIDGVISTALGASRLLERNVLFIGDVAFAHDASAMLNHSYTSHHLDIVVINNQGGRIFEMLPIQEYPPSIMSQLFLTPPQIDIESLCSAYGLPYKKVTHLSEIANHSWASEGVRVIECITAPEQSMKERRFLWNFHP